MFSIVCLKIYRQIVCMEGCILTPLEFVWRFSAMYFQMCFQTALFSWGMYLHLVDFSPLCLIKCVLQLAFYGDAKWHWLHYFALSLLCIFKCAFKLVGLGVAWSHLVHLWDLSLLFDSKCVSQICICIFICICIWSFNFYSIRTQSFLKSRKVLVCGHIWKSE